MDVKEFMGMMALFALVVIPALAITARIAMRPIVDSIIRLREGLASTAPRPPQVVDNEQLRLLQNEVADLRQAVEQLKDVVEFERALQRPSEAKQITSSS